MPRSGRPIAVGELVELHANLVYTGRTSMHVAVDVRAGDPKESAFTRTTHCVIVFVAVDDQGAPTPVTAWSPETEDEIAQSQYALQLMEIRTRIESQMDTGKTP